LSFEFGVTEVFEGLTGHTGYIFATDGTEDTEI